MFNWGKKKSETPISDKDVDNFLDQVSKTYQVPKRMLIGESLSPFDNIKQGDIFQLKGVADHRIVISMAKDGYVCCIHNNGFARQVDRIFWNSLMAEIYDYIGNTNNITVTVGEVK